MRVTPLPLLRDLETGVIVQRCRACGVLALADELCEDEDEAEACMADDVTPAED